MSKKFSKPIEAYNLGRITPIAIEQDRTGLGKYQRYHDNPIYFYNALQYCGGALYRATLGYETFWDSKAEAQLMLCLDYFLTDLRDKKSYYFEELKSTINFKQHGLRWHRGIAPRTIKFDMQWPFEVKAGDRVTARINLIDKPHHVDLELPSGEVYSVQYLKYQRLKYNFNIIKGEPNDYRRYAKSTLGAKGPKRTGFEMAKRPIYRDSLRKVFTRLSSMR